MPESDSVVYEISDGVATITLNRPDSMNSLTVEAKEALLAAVERAKSDREARAVLLTGNGKAFCAGQDLREHAASLGEGQGLGDTVRKHYNPIVLALARMPKPVVAAVNGVAAGAGASIAFACDLRVASDRASFVMAFANVGLGSDSGASWTLPRLVGHARAAELLLLAEPVPARRALEIGLVTKVVPADELAASARELALRLANGPTVAYAAIKAELTFGSGLDLQNALEMEASLQEQCAETADHLNATLSFVNKTTPVFEGR
ncbi:enoyl-CoA hydratase-related protein [Marinitenerispora sediminis]|uniref:Enoyl-CoA hydratase n=1 Tax=Marinitenerispora sediminis TaxID=1931232 RepID=A0A368T376_9ACTN|nr:enoyl-CoA hydratase-related protein [Marinitenerispora sediminis]RCV55848.1 enoyl-CoA hydratase [Marinitenerispora sediminis]RCV56562.1 enoyl-CoA hydratase [Marinitenerispora sediminis]RCV59400.1 enoyl-CoA hydratase [Marinitenerispora sediminis]